MTGALVPTHLAEKGVKQAQQTTKHWASSVLTHGRQRAQVCTGAGDKGGTTLGRDCVSGSGHNRGALYVSLQSKPQTTETVISTHSKLKAGTAAHIAS